MKRIFFFVLILLIFPTSAKAEKYDYEPGLIFDASDKVTDGYFDTAEKVRFRGGTKTIKLETPVKIDSYIFDRQYSMFVYFYDIQGNEIYSGRLHESKSTRNIPSEIKNKSVKKVVVRNNRGNSSDLYALEFYGHKIKPYEPKDIKSLTSDVYYNRVSLNWVNPGRFSQVNIYRENVQTGDIKSYKTTSDNFVDKTAADSKYKYKITTENNVSKESEGVEIKVETPESPELDGVESDKSENGDYIYRWTKPKHGQVIIYVGGKEYATVDAADGSITIPKEDMVYKPLTGAPDVSLQPVGDDGNVGDKEGTGNALGDVQTPFDAIDILKSSFSLLSVFGSFILLLLAIRFAPILFQLIKKANEIKKGG